MTLSVKKAREVLSLLKEGVVFEDVRFVGDSKPHKITKVLEQVQRGRNGYTHMDFVDENGRKLHVEDRGYKVKNALTDPSEGELAVFVIKNADTGEELRLSTRREDGTAYITKTKLEKGTEPIFLKIKLWLSPEDLKKELGIQEPTPVVPVA
jgi:hypothetical protein